MRKRHLLLRSRNTSWVRSNTSIFLFPVVRFCVAVAFFYFVYTGGTGVFLLEAETSQLPPTVPAVGEIEVAADGTPCPTQLSVLSVVVFADRRAMFIASTNSPSCIRQQHRLFFCGVCMFCCRTFNSVLRRQTSRD